MMKQTLLVLAALMTLQQSLGADDKKVDPARYADLVKMNAVLSDPALSIRAAIEKPESYVLKLEARSPQGSQLLMGYLDKNSSSLYIGTGYMKDGHPILIPADASAIKNAVAFTYGNGKEEIYLVTDPECPYCGKFARNSEGKMGDYKVHVIFFPLSFHKKSLAMIEWIMQGKDDAAKKKRYDEIMLRASTLYASDANASKPFVNSPKVQEMLEKAKQGTMELNVRGTPMLFDAAFNPLSMDEILKTGK